MPSVSWSSVDLRSGNVGIVTGSHEQSLGGGLGLLGLLFAMDQLGQLKGKDLLGLIDLGILPGVHLIDLLQRQEE